MKKVLLCFLSLMIFFTGSLKADLQSDLNKNLYKSIGSAAAKAAGLPLDEVTSIASAFEKGDFKTAFSNLASWATDSMLDLIPVYGPAKFASDLVISFGNVLMTYINNSIIESMWQRFMNLSDSEKEDWLNGNDDDYPEMTYYYGSLNVTPDELRKIFKTAWKEYKKQQKQAKTYMEYTAKISKIIKQAQEKLTPDLYYPSNGSKIKISSKIEIWRSKNNYFKLVLKLPDGATYTKFIKDPSDPNKNHITSFKLTDFEGIDWNKYFQQYPEGVNIKIDVTAAVYDTTGLMKILMPDLVTPKNSIVKIKNYDGNIFEKTQFQFTVVSDIISCEKRLYGKLYFDYSFYIDSGTESTDVFSTNMKFQCDINSGKAILDLDGSKISGRCENKKGYFSGPLGYGSIVLNIVVSCEPEKLTVSSSGSYIYRYTFYDDNGNPEEIYIEFKNIRGTFK